MHFGLDPCSNATQNCRQNVAETTASTKGANDDEAVTGTSHDKQEQPEQVYIRIETKVGILHLAQEKTLKVQTSSLLRRRAFLTRHSAERSRFFSFMGKGT